MATESQRQVNPIIELAGTQWFVPDWDILEMARLPTNMPQTITLCRLTPQEQRLAADGALPGAIVAGEYLQTAASATAIFFGYEFDMALSLAGALTNLPDNAPLAAPAPNDKIDDPTLQDALKRCP